jgi:hypothetical protein
MHRKNIISIFFVKNVASSQWFICLGLAAPLPIVIGSNLPLGRVKMLPNM